MGTRSCLFPVLTVLAHCAAGQSPCPPNPVNTLQGLGMFNTEVGGTVEFPNFRSAQGNNPADRLWKIYPKEAFVRPRRDSNFISGVTFPWKVHNFTGAPCGGIVGYEIRGTVRNASGWLVPDMASPPLMMRTIGTFTFGLDRYWLVRVDVYPRAWLAVPSTDVAVLLMAEPGRNATQNDVYTAFRSTHERYDRSPQPSFSGRVNGVTGQIELLVPPIAPEACELQIELCFWEPVARVSATSSKTTPIDAQELATGVGAFYNDLASTGGQLRWYFEMDGADPRFCLFFPLFARRRLTTPVVNLFPCPIDFDAADPLTALLYQMWGPIQLSWRSPYSQFSNLVGTTPWITIPQDMSLQGTTVYAGCVMYAPLLGRFILQTNMVETTLR